MKQDVDNTDGRQTWYKSETAKIGKNCDIRHGAIIEDNVIIGNNCFIGEYSHLAEGTVVEDNVYIGPGVLTVAVEKVGYMRSFTEKSSAPYIEFGVRIAARAVIFPGVVVGKNALIGIAAVITKDVPARQIHFGFPAKKRGTVPDGECISDGLIIKAQSKDKP